MDFSCAKENVYRAIQIVEKAVSFKSTLPIIGNILLETTKEGLKLYSNDLEIGIEVVIPAKISSHGLILIPAKTLSGIVSKLPDEEIFFKVAERARLEIICGTSRFSLNTLSPDDFPALPVIKKDKVFQISGEIFQKMIQGVIIAVSQDESKHILNGILMELDNKEMTLVATDGYRLAKYTEQLKASLPGKATIIIPSKALSQLLFVLSQPSKTDSEVGLVEVAVSVDQISFKYKNVYFVSRLIQGQFPNYNQVIPKDFKTEFTLKRKELLEAFERSAVIAFSSANIVKLRIAEDKLYISANTPDLGNSSEWLALKIKGENKAQVAFNVKLIIDILKNLTGEEIIFGLNGALNPGMIKPKEEKENYLYIVMPIRTVESQGE
jgi:DNA polymerase-3 subunit beta